MTYTGPGSWGDATGRTLGGSPQAAPTPRFQPSGGDGTIVIRPSREQYRASIRKTPVVFIILAVFMVVRAGVEGLVLACVLAGIALAGMAIYLRRARIEIRRTQVTRSGLLRTRTYLLGDIGQVLLYPLKPGGGETRVFDTAHVRDRAGRTMFRVRTDVWAPQDVVALAHGLGVHPHTVREPIRPEELERAFPGSTPWVQRHPVATALLAATGIIVVAILLVAVFMGLAH